MIFPAWALPISVAARAFVFFGLLIYFVISEGIMHRLFNTLTLSKPVIVKTLNWREHVRNNLLLVIVSCIALILHIRYLFLPILILGDETIHLGNGLWIYQYIDSKWHSLIQIIFWVLISLAILIKRKTSKDNFVSNILDSLVGSTKDNSLKYPFIIFGSFLATYFFLLRNINYFSSSIRYPPVSKLIYFLAYSASGINHVFPRTIQLIFCLLCACYLYRTINLFFEKQTALLGATIYLFLPVTFVYAHLGELESGVIFFIVTISFYFIRFIKDRDERDLLLATYLIGIGYLYKDPVFLVFPVCLIFLVFLIIKKNTLYSLVHLKILSLALMAVIPWMIIEKLYSWRNYTFQLSNITSLNNKIIPYFLLISSNLSGIVFFMLVLSVLYICFSKRNTLTIFFGLLFIIYYFFIISDIGSLSPRFSMAFYPTITIFISLFISAIIQHIKWRHAFKLCFIVITTYLIIISSVSPLNSRYLVGEDKKLYYYPSDKAMMWVKENVKEGEKVLAIRILSSMFYRYKYAIEPHKMVDITYDMEQIYTPEKLKQFYREQNISYIVFPYSAAYIKNDIRSGILEYLRNNSNKEFAETAKFNIDDKFIYIYKLRDDTRK